MAAGRITIMKETTIVVDGRNKSTSEEHFKCWCDVSDLLSNEKYEALQQSLEETAVFKVRRCKKPRRCGCITKSIRSSSRAKNMTSFP